MSLTNHAAEEHVLPPEVLPYNKSCDPCTVQVTDLVLLPSPTLSATVAYPTAYGNASAFLEVGACRSSPGVYSASAAGARQQR